MGFFKDFKDDLSQAVNELLPEDKANLEETEEQMVNTLDADTNAAKEVAGSDKMKEWLNELAEEGNDGESDTNGEKDDLGSGNEFEDAENEEGAGVDDNVDLELLDALNKDEETEEAAASEENEKEDMQKVRSASTAKDAEISVISKGTIINGSISSGGALDIMGNVTGDIDCHGKLSITGKVMGDVSASEVFINTDRLEGNITSEGTVKIGLGTVLIGNVSGKSGVIAGAVKGEIDINGPVVIDSTAIIKGNIKAKSVQINNGAIIDGFCSLSYSDVNIDDIFE
ncbi:MAG TPA: cell shape determination protein CcmA [Lachnospiraceae bacterium]|jgi:cytoskeletal protein CcmA (bactofilin family)|nr:cell shape determination protein CcmA [Lachnospiraceae bacterium]HBY72073.1 cell shape determination protein CcmA [Lachnospiraceae bacterium]HCA68897.1 cell shape determination protein CcmA [Lachnospiraceae bacterium]HCM11693.1 cell shape determination protein CcmA [Lachnospiraceae bacterium]HCR41557.1 cell shape determination protein CcmA [Lachnospiraceae bacterium]